jgi:hypothetical protein
LSGTAGKIGGFAGVFTFPLLMGMERFAGS